MSQGRSQALPAARRWPSWSTVLILLNMGVFIAQQGLGWKVAIGPGGSVLPEGGVSLSELAAGKVWTLITSLFVHLSVGHLLGNLVLIALFGRLVAGLLGPGAFLQIYFASGLVGAALQMVLQALFGGDLVTLVQGSSACACGLLAAAATVLPEEPVSDLIYSILPIRFTLRRVVAWLALCTCLLGLTALLSPWAKEQWGGNAYFAHVGGMLVGWYWVRLLGYGDRPLTYSTLLREGRHRSPAEFKAQLSRVEAQARLTAVMPEMDNEAMEEGSRPSVKPADPIVADIDSILEKISRDGMTSLSNDERRELERASRELAAKKRKP
jgi:membrane associated rhomboid family serine protease